MQAGRRVLSQNPETELPGLSFGCAAGNSSEGQWRGIAGSGGRGGGGSLSDHPKTRAGRGVLIQNPETEPPGLGFGCATGNSSEV